jgi:hypothetical protein
MWPKPVFPKLIDKIRPKIRATFIIFKKVPKENNGQKFANLVTLYDSQPIRKVSREQLG